MIAILGILFSIIIIGSLTITFIAIFQILNNDFKESKGLWIVISMIAFIGPILWLIKGRKLIVKLSPEEKMEMKNRLNVKSHYIEILKESILIKSMTFIAVSMILLGYLVRVLNIYFLWEIKALGYVILLISLAAFLWHDFKVRKSKKVKSIWSGVGFGLICFALFMKGIMMIMLPLSDAYAAAKTQLQNNIELTSEIGEITGISVLPSGSLQTRTDTNGTFGTASLNLIIKGTEKYLDRTVFLEITPEKDWEIITIKK